MTMIHIASLSSQISVFDTHFTLYTAVKVLREHEMGCAEADHLKD